MSLDIAECPPGGAKLLPDEPRYKHALVGSEIPPEGSSPSLIFSLPDELLLAPWGRLPAIRHSLDGRAYGINPLTGGMVLPQATPPTP